MGAEDSHKKKENRCGMHFLKSSNPEQVSFEYTYISQAAVLLD